MSTRRESFKNNASTTLAANIDNVVTSVSVADGTVFPSSGDFRIVIGSEVMLVTAVSGNTLTVVRGQEGTTAVSHNSTDPVTHVLTAGAIQRYGRDNDPDFDSNRPPFRIVDSSGNAMTSADFTTVNLSTATIIDDASGSITIRKATQGAVEDVTALVRAAPAAPYSVIAAVSTCWPTTPASSAAPSCGIGFRESSTGKQFFVALNDDSSSANRESLSVYKYTSPTTFSAAAVDRHGCTIRDRYVWFKATDDATSLKFYVSHDGVNWAQIYSEARTTFMAGAPDQIMFGANNRGNSSFEILTTLKSWSEG